MKGKILTGPHEGKIGNIIGEDEDGWTVVDLGDNGGKISRLPTEVEEIEEEEPETVDITPSWPAVLHMMLIVLDNKNASPEGKKAAMDGLTQMADVAQQYVDLFKNGNVAGVQLEKVDQGQYGDYYGVILNFPNKKRAVIRIEEHQFNEFKQFYENAPKRSGMFGKDELYTH